TNVVGTLRYEESAPGQPFGTTLRFSASSLPSALTLVVSNGMMQDLAGNPNLWEQHVLSASSGYQGPGADGSATTVLARAALGSPFAFQGQIFDADTGLIYLRARFYDPASGSFLQRDPSGYKDSVNQYAGFANNPINVRDPMGLYSEAGHY